MTSTKTDGVGCAGDVEVVDLSLLHGEVVAEGVDFLLCQSSSTSGPSAREKPRREKMSMISFFTNVRG